MDFDPAQLEALAFSLSEGSFDAAARALHVTPSAISQRIKALETAVGQILVTRTRPVQPTRAGEAVLRLATQIRAITAEVARELGGTSGQDVNVTVPLAVNADSLATWVLPALAGVDAAVVFDIQREDQDRTAELLRRGTVMAAITASADPVPGCSVDRLGSMHYRPMAAPEFARRWLPDGPTPAALAVAPVVVFDRNDRLQDRYLRRRSHRQARPPRHYIPGSADFLEAVRLGLGWGMVPDQQIEPHRADSTLVDLDPGHGIKVPLYWQQWRLASAALEQVATAIRAAARASLG